ncbi:MAG TPA: glycosyltransferase family 4 protein [Actinobacteria bacterium]|nr:glycosyltransferase family 4 protein [Actinomycetota bacterium]
MIAPVWIRVPPEAYGGIELIVSLLVEGLVAKGHDVTLFASGDSVTRAKLVSVYPQPQTEKMGSFLPNMFHVGSAYDCCRQDDFDIIHDHTSYWGAVFGPHMDKPVLVTLHGELNSSTIPLLKKFKDAVYYNAVSENQRRLLPELRYVKTVRNTIDFGSFTVQTDKRGYLLSFSRICPEKGIHIAIEVSKESGKPLIIAGKIDNRYPEYFKNMIEPQVDGVNIQFLGEVSARQKRDLMSGADCLLFPIQWDEPFGLVMLESMACGTPVVAFDRGATAEVIISGQNGFVVESVAQMVGVLDRCSSIDPLVCRRWVETNFSIDRMIDGYLENYYNILHTEGQIGRSLNAA